jgi:hypothetical protein
MARPATTKHFKNWNMGSDCKISCHACRFPHNMAVQNWWTCPPGSFQSNMFKIPDVHPKLHPREALSRYFETFFFLLNLRHFQYIILGMWSQNLSNHGRMLEEYFNPWDTIASFSSMIHIWWSTCFQLPSSVDHIEDDSYDFDKFVIPHHSRFSSSPLPLLTKFLRGLSIIRP